MASSRCSVSVSSEPEKVSREASNESPIEYSSSADLEGAAVERPRPFVEQARSQVGDAGLALRVLG